MRAMSIESSGGMQLHGFVVEAAGVVGVAPCQLAALGGLEETVAQLAEHAEQQDRRQHDVRSSRLATIGEQIAQPAGRSDQLRRDEKHPAQPQALRAAP